MLLWYKSETFRFILTLYFGWLHHCEVVWCFSADMLEILLAHFYGKHTAIKRIVSNVCRNFLLINQKFINKTKLDSQANEL
jgi:hypothetical protein